MSIKHTLLFYLFIPLSFFSLSGQEIGTNDFQISFTGPNGNTDYEAKNPATAYNSTDNEYLIVWIAKNKPQNGGNVLQYEIWGQRLEGDSASTIGSAFRISDMGPEDSDAYGANAPAVAYNSVENEYMVVWYGDDNTGNAMRNEAEIWGQRIDAATGQEVGQNDFRISRMGPDGNPLADGKFPAIAYNSQDNEYLVVWYGDVFFDEKIEVWGQRLRATGQEVGADDFRISVMGPNTNVNYGGYDPAVTYNNIENEYLVVWYGSNLDVAENENEVWGQRINNTGNFLGEAGFRISDIGKDDSKNFAAKSPNVVFNSEDNEYLVVWSGNEENYDKNDYRTWGQRLDGITGAEIGENDFLISDLGPDQVLPSGNHVVDVAYNRLSNHYLVVWSADDYDGANTDNELEIWGKRLNGIDGSAIEMEEFRVSDAGVDGNEDFDAERPYIVFNQQQQEYLVVWEANEQDEKFEIYGQRLVFEIEEPTCDDGQQNGDEEGVDCGGSCADMCPTCDDGQQNGDEEGVDCGGSCPTICLPMICIDTLIQADPMPQGVYQNYQSITSNGTIEAFDTVEFSAADYILLEVGFHAAHNSRFTAHIAACEEEMPEEELEQRSVVKLSVFPNPTENNLNIRFQANEANELTAYALYDLHGRKILEGKWANITGENQQHLEVSNLTRGMYILKIENRVVKVILH